MPILSLIVLAWDQLDLTKRCVESLRANTDVPFELIIVDNGSAPEAAEWAHDNADIAVLHPENLGFARGMNAGLERVTGEFVAFINNDTEFPPGWASTLLENFESNPNAGIVLPAVTAAGNQVSVRTQPGTDAITFVPFSEIPSGVVYLMRTTICRELGGWNEMYELATGEDLDLLFTVWTNDLDVTLDTRVLVDHESQGTLATKLRNKGALQRRNLAIFLDRWTEGHPPPPRRGGCSPDVHLRNRRAAAAATTWLARMVEARRQARQAISDSTTPILP